MFLLSAPPPAPPRAPHLQKWISFLPSRPGLAAEPLTLCHGQPLPSAAPQVPAEALDTLLLPRGGAAAGVGACSPAEIRIKAKREPALLLYKPRSGEFPGDTQSSLGSVSDRVGERVLPRRSQGLSPPQVEGADLKQTSTPGAPADALVGAPLTEGPAQASP